MKQIKALGFRRFYPDLYHHTTVHMQLLSCLDSGLSDQVILCLWDACHKISSIHSLEKLTEHGELKKTITHSVADSLDKATEWLECEDSILSLRLRSKMLREGASRDVHEELVGLNEQELISVCGPLGTWLGKSRKLFHSALFAIPDKKINIMIKKVDRSHLECQRFLRTLVHPKLIVQTPPLINFANLMFCSGEADLYPKHYAYFLPEDEGVKKMPSKKTLVFINVYSQMYSLISKKFSENIIQSSVDGASNDDVKNQLALWFRGHDTGHGVQLPETNYKAMRCRGHWLSMVLQETIADVFGFILSTSRPWVEISVRSDLRLASDIFVQEMLRYLCRGGDDFPDAGATLIQMSFLCQNGFIELDFNTIQIKYDPDRLYDGMVVLAKYLTENVLSNDTGRITDLIDAHYHNQEIRDFVRLCGVCNLVLDYEQSIPASQMETI